MGFSLAWLLLQPSLSQNWLLLSVRTQEQPYLLDEAATTPDCPKIDAEGRTRKSGQPNKFPQPCREASASCWRKTQPRAEPSPWNPTISMKQRRKQVDPIHCPVIRF